MPKKYPEGAVDYSIHEWMKTAHYKSLTILEQYLSLGVFLGKPYEQDDAAVLCAFVREISCAYYDFHEDSQYYNWLCRIAAEYYDLKINKQDIKACFKALGVIARFANQSNETADDLDNIVSASAALEVTGDFQAALRITHVDINKFGVAQVSSPRLRNFLDNGPQLFNFCQTESIPNIETEFYNADWSFWQQTNQTIWVDPDGIISVRIKADGEITVGFLGTDPYDSNGWLNRSLLSNRTTEQLKLTAAYGLDISVVIPAALNGDTPFWNGYYPQLMAKAHINK
jgi:hypothetical protein